jgi:hypothetical protein
MFNVTFDSANKLQWPNPHIDFILASNLFLGLYKTRPESKPFLIHKNKFEFDCLEHAHNLPDLAKDLRSVFKVGKFGSSREKTNHSMVSFLNACLPAIFIVIVRRYTNPVLKRYIESVPVRQAFEGFLKYRHQYTIEYIRKPLGGTWIPQRLTIKDIIGSFIQGITASRLLLDRRCIVLIDYMTNITELCYSSGLRCWWVPLFTIADDISRWAGPVPKEELESPTIDGLLGTVFPRLISDTLIVSQDGETISSDTHYEWPLISMSDEERRKYIGIPHNRKVKQQLKKWGYVPAHKWRKTDFHMLFDRLLAHQSIEILSERYDRDPATIKRRTANLAKILRINIPKAPHKKHRHN